MHRPGRIGFLFSLLCLAGCRGKERPVFELLGAERTGIGFANTITTSDSLNVQTDVYVYNGAGVAVGDVDNDGLPDIFFSGNMVTSRLYLNRGGLRFDDMTERAGVRTKRWATGATMVDINNDGYLDIYVSVSGPEWSKPEERANLLFVNNRNRTFTEAAAQYGVADTGFTTHAAFLDYDGDGCLDLFLLENSPGDFSRSNVAGTPSGLRGETPGGLNRLLRNTCHGSFVDVSAAAGIVHEPGFGLGVAVTDFNGDGRPDLYVSNDVVANDVLYLNRGDGTFANRAAQSLKHASFAGMGVDAADFNNDGWPDIVQSEMLPRALERQKRTLGFATYASMTDLVRRGIRLDYSSNSLQLSNGITKEGDVVFSEIARLAGISHTDWSWSTLFADFDDDGNKDLFIGNGYPKALTDLDYMSAMASAMRPSRAPAARSGALENLRRLPSYLEVSYLFRNAGDLTFADVTKAWGIDKPAFSYGAAYADLDNDGRLDLVVNNIDGPAFIYHNVRGRDDAHHVLNVRLEGDGANRRGIGSTLILTAGGRKQYLYHSPYRGYMSTMDDRAHFGLGVANRVDSLEVIWPDGRSQLLTGIDADRLLVVRQANAAGKKAPPLLPAPTGVARPFEQLDAARSGLAYKHQPGPTIDYSIQALLPYMVSRHGPVLAVRDVDGDGLEDLYIGGGFGVPAELRLQQKDGRFVASSAAKPWAQDKGFEDWGATFFDADGDGRPDLYVASGGYELSSASPLLQDRLYLNRGGGRFERDTLALPRMLTSTAAVRVGDFTGDGQPDLFVGGRLSPRTYPFPARSYLLRNEHGRFTDVTESFAPELVHPGGMITDAVWVDFDGDGRLDLVTAGEWMGIRFYRNDGRRLRDVTSATRLPSMRGWWYSLAVGDFDGDGRPDIVAGNLGLNHSYSTSNDSTFGVYAGDFTGNQATDVVLSRRIDGTEYPIAGMEPLGREIYTLSLKFPTHGSFASASLDQLFGRAQLQKALHYEADTFASVYLHNDGGGSFSSAPLPALAQIAPIRAIVPYDVNRDGHLDLIIGGNLYDVEANTPRADAGNGLWLRGDGRGHFVPVSPRESGFLAPLNVAGFALIDTPTGRMVLVANTGDSLQIFRIDRR
ncbi:MAG: VCBS repeat-containing protein [Gemmatimonadaceae bacterium]